MDVSLLAAGATFVVVSLGTPGPNNLMLASSGLSFGFRRTVPLLLGIQIGFQALLVAVASGFGVVFERYPGAHWVLKILGSAYLLLLAYKLWRASALGTSAMERPLGFLKGAIFQLVNPKAWMTTVSAVGAYTATGEDYWPSVGLLIALFFVLGVPLLALWASLGSTFRDRFQDPDNARNFGRGMAVATGTSCLLIFL